MNRILKMLNCIYQDIVVEKVSQEFSPSGISETFLEIKSSSSIWILFRTIGQLIWYFFLCQSVHALIGGNSDLLDVKQISLTWILLIYSNFEILAWCIIFAKKYWNVFAFFERRVQMVGDLFRSVLHFFYSSL